MYRRNHWQVVTKTDGKGIPYRRKFFIVAAIILLVFIWGNFWGMPLTRKDSFRFKNKYMSYLAINPMQNFFSTLKERKPNFSKEKAKAVFPLVSQWMQWPVSDTAFSYKRVIKNTDSVGGSMPNIVLVQLESFSMYKSSMSGNPLSTTPYLKSLCDSGIFSIVALRHIFLQQEPCLLYLQEFRMHSYLNFLPAYPKRWISILLSMISKAMKNFIFWAAAPVSTILKAFSRI
jgi:hypothetical protein